MQTLLLSKLFRFGANLNAIPMIKYCIRQDKKQTHRMRSGYETRENIQSVLSECQQI